MLTQDHTTAPFIKKIQISEYVNRMDQNGLPSIRVVEYRGIGDYPGAMKTFGGDMANDNDENDDDLFATDEEEAEYVRQNRRGKSRAARRAT